MDTSKTRSEYTFVIEPHFILIIPKCENNEGPRLESSVELNALPRISQTLATPMTYTKPVREHVPGMSHGVDLTTSEDEADHAKGESRASELSLTINRTHQKPKPLSFKTMNAIYVFIGGSRASQASNRTHQKQGSKMVSRSLG